MRSNNSSGDWLLFSFSYLFCSPVVGSPIKLFSQTWLIRQSGVAIYRSFASRMTSDAGPVEVSIQTKLQESLKVMYTCSTQTSPAAVKI